MTASVIPELAIAIANYRDSADATAIVALLDAYARDPMGGGTPLSDDVRDRLAPALADQPGAFTLIARVAGEPAGLANCFAGFSTFAARPLINIHDIAVLPQYRGKGVGRALLNAVAQEAQLRGACKITLEVLSGNEPAIAAYRQAGFVQYGLDPAMGTAQFWERKLP